jgi:hypothetical protein
MGTIWWGRLADRDLKGIYDRGVIAELMDLAERELRYPPRGNHQADEGWVPEYPGVAYRRGALRAAADGGQDLADDQEEQATYRACDYYLVYRQPRPKDAWQTSRGGGAVRLVVIRLLHITEMALLLRPA